MAKQNAKTNEEQGQQSWAMQGSQGGSLARRGGSNPFGLTLSPFEVFLANPFSLMRRMSEEMDRAFAEFSGSNGDTSLWAPAVEVSQRDGQYFVKADLPGMRPEDVKVEARDGALIIEGERKSEREEDRGRTHRTEVRYGRFYRVIPLPDEAKIEQAQAKFENGVLQVTVPVPEQRTNQRQIPIQQANPGSKQPGSTGSSGSTQGSEKAA